jgi:competence protein ComEA
MHPLFALLLAVWVLIGQAWAGVNINAADAEELKTLPGIGDTKAAAILAYRAQNGPFTSVDQLGDVSGIGPATIEKLRPLVEIGAGGAKAEGGAKPEGGASAGGAAAAAPVGPAVNINTASAEELDALPGIGATKAAAIVADRSANGPFASCDDLGRITGIGPATVEKLRPQCTTK